MFFQCFIYCRADVSFKTVWSVFHHFYCNIISSTCFVICYFPQRVLYFIFRNCSIMVLVLQWIFQNPGLVRKTAFYSDFSHVYIVSLCWWENAHFYHELEYFHLSKELHTVVCYIYLICNIIFLLFLTHSLSFLISSRGRFLSFLIFSQLLNHSCQWFFIQISFCLTDVQLLGYTFGSFLTLVLQS